MMKDTTASKQLTKRFTLDEANAMLPLVRSIVSDICEVYRNVTGRRVDLHRLLRKRTQGSAPLYEDEMAQSRADLQEEYDQIWKYREELESLGVLLSHPEAGCIEFPTMIDGREGFFSWQLGEDSIRFVRDAVPNAPRRPIHAEPLDN